MVLDIWQRAAQDEDYSGLPELNDNWFTDQAKERLQKKNFVVLLTADTGGGKSLLAQALLENVDPGFTLADVYFDELLFFDMVRDIARKAAEQDILLEAEGLAARTSDKVKDIVTWDNLGQELDPGLGGRGSLIDEGGITADPYRWNSIMGRALKGVLETFRYQRQVVIIAVPFVELVNVNIRRLCHAWIQIKRTGFAVVYGIQTRRDKDKWEKRVPIKYGTLSDWQPPQRVNVKDYWRKKHKANLLYLDNLSNEMQQRMDEIRGTGMVPRALPPRIEDDRGKGPYR